LNAVVYITQNSKEHLKLLGFSVFIDKKPMLKLHKLNKRHFQTFNLKKKNTTAFENRNLVVLKFPNLASDTSIQLMKNSDKICNRSCQYTCIKDEQAQNPQYSWHLFIKKEV